MTKAQIEEKDSQADYEGMRRKSAEKRTLNSKSLTQKSATKASVEGDLEMHNKDKGHKTKELMAHPGCIRKKQGPAKLMNSEKLLKGMNFPATA